MNWFQIPRSAQNIQLCFAMTGTLSRIRRFLDRINRIRRTLSCSECISVVAISFVSICTGEQRFAASSASVLDAEGSSPAKDGSVLCFYKQVLPFL